MKSSNIGFLWLLTLSMLAPAGSSWAVPRNWNVGSGNWSSASNWSPFGVPVNGDDVSILSADGVNRVVTYDYIGPSVTLNSLKVGLSNYMGTDAATISLTTNNALSAVSQHIGTSTSGNGAGAFTQSAGFNSVGTGNLYIGFNATDVGYYHLSGSGTLYSSGYEYVGASGTGTFVQSGGTHFIFPGRFLDLGLGPASHGTYDMSGGTLNAENVYVGDQGVGVFNHIGGTSTISQSLTLGYVAGSSGTFNANGGLLEIGDDLIVGNNGTGILSVGASGAVAVSDKLQIGSQGTVNLNGGSLRFNTYSRAGVLNFNSGTITLAGDRDFLADATILDIFGAPNPTISTGKKLRVEQTATIRGRTLFVAGGIFEAAVANIGGFNNVGNLYLSGDGVASAITTLIGTNLGESVATVSGTSQLVSTNMFVGVSGGGGTLTIQDQGFVSVANTLTLGGAGLVNLNGGVLRFSNISKDNNSVLNYVSGTILLTGDRTVDSDVAVKTVFGTTPNIGVGKKLQIQGQAVLSTSGPVNLAGGTLAGDSVLLLTGSRLVASQASTVDAPVLALAGSLIQTSNGQLTLGKASAVNGFGTQGNLQVGAGAVTLLDANDAVFDSLSLTTLGSGASPGALNAANGLTLDFGANLIGFGAVSTPDNVATPLVNNGHITGSSAAQRITLSGYVKGVGTFDNVNFTGTFSPGLSPTRLSVGSIALAASSTLVMEVGGVAPGSGYDQILATGALDFDGVLKVSLVNGFNPAAGQSFNLFDWASVSGAFDSIVLPSLDEGLFWNTSQLYTAGNLFVTGELPADFDQDQDVDGDDLTRWQTNFGSFTGATHSQGDADGDQDVDGQDFLVWQQQFGSDVGATESLTSVPEPATDLLAGAWTAGCMAWRRRGGYRRTS